MNTITHALLPVIGVSIVNGTSHAYWTKSRIIVVGVSGALPDLLDPHLSLEARYSSWSHGLPALVGLMAFLFALSCISRIGMGSRLATWMSLAYAFHLFCDLIAGGIAWMYPFGYSIVGEYYVPPVFWIPMDIVCTLSVYFLFRAIPRYRAGKKKN